MLEDSNKGYVPNTALVESKTGVFLRCNGNCFDTHKKRNVLTRFESLIKKNSQ